MGLRVPSEDFDVVSGFLLAWWLCLIALRLFACGVVGGSVRLGVPCVSIMCCRCWFAVVWCFVVLVVDCGGFETWVCLAVVWVVSDGFGLRVVWVVLGEFSVGGVLVVFLVVLRLRVGYSVAFRFSGMWLLRVCLVGFCGFSCLVWLWGGGFVVISSCGDWFGLLFG